MYHGILVLSLPVGILFFNFFTASFVYFDASSACLLSLRVLREMALLKLNAVPHLSMLSLLQYLDCNVLTMPS